MAVPDFLHPFAAPANESFVNIVRGDGATVEDDTGRTYIDAMASLWYCAVGHGRQEIKAAVAEQLDRLDAFHAFDVFTNPPADALASELAAIAPGNGFRTFFTSSGSESVDSAIKIARAAHACAGQPSRRLIISRAPSYHGVTFGGMSATGLPANQQNFGSMLPDVVQVPYDDADALRAIVEERPDEFAGILAEPVVGAGGVYLPPDGYFAELREICDEHGGYLIMDEVICGFGRLGHWWGSQHYGVRPDLVTFAKGVTSGYIPLGGVLVGPAPRDALEADSSFVLRHGHTYSGHPVACAAGLAAVALLRDDRLIERAPAIGRRLADGFQKLADEGLVAEVRGAGGMWALGMHPDVDAGAIRNNLLDEGVISRPIGNHTLAFCPPLVITDSQIDACVSAAEAALRRG